MRRSSNPIRILGIMLAAVLSFAISGIAQVGGRASTKGAADAAAPAQVVAPCASALSSASADSASSPVDPKAHSVTLSWKASVPRSNSEQDVIQGYYVYRSLISNRYAESNKLNVNPLPTTQCVDAAVTPGIIYFYVVKAVAKTGLSGPSNEARAPIPPPS